MNDLLTVQNIIDQKFSKSFRGYNEEEVDYFLDDVIHTLQSKDEEIRNLTDRLDEVKKKLDGALAAKPARPAEEAQRRPAAAPASRREQESSHSANDSHTTPANPAQAEKHNAPAQQPAPERPALQAKAKPAAEATPARVAPAVNRPYEPAESGGAAKKNPLGPDMAVSRNNAPVKTQGTGEPASSYTMQNGVSVIRPVPRKQTAEASRPLPAEVRDAVARPQAMRYQSEFSKEAYDAPQINRSARDTAYNTAKEEPAEPITGDRMLRRPVPRKEKESNADKAAKDASVIGTSRPAELRDTLKALGIYKE